MEKDYERMWSELYAFVRVCHLNFLGHTVEFKVEDVEAYDKIMKTGIDTDFVAIMNQMNKIENRA